MILSLYTAPTTTPIDLEEAKAHARVEVADDDALIQGLIGAAVAYAEWYTQRALEPQVWDLVLEEFPSDKREIELPKPPLQEVISISYLDSNGDEQSFATDNYRVLAPAGPLADPGRVVLLSGKTWPIARREPGAVTVRFRAGYGTEDEGDVPEAIGTALKVHVAEMYENREASIHTGAIVQEVPYGVRSLLWPFRVVKF